MSTAVTKAEIIDDLHTRLDGSVSKSIINKVFDTMGEQVLDTALGGHAYPLGRVGRFVPVKLGSRRARNPQTGEAIEVPPRQRLHFKPSEHTKRRLNE